MLDILTGAHSSLVVTFGGVAFFVYGMQLASDNMQKLAAGRIRNIITSLAQRPFRGVFLGMGLTVILQSSGAATSMLVGLGSAGVINLKQVMSVILGTAIGATFTVQILSFNVAQFGLPLFALSFFIYFLSKHRKLRDCMGAVMGFGLLFWGLDMVQSGTQEMQNFELFNSFIQALKQNPLWALILSALITAIVHSSAMTITLAMTLAAHGSISLADSVYWIFGANIGTTAIALIASSSGNYVGRQVAWAHCFYKVLSVLIFIPIAPYLADWLSTGNAERDVANINTVYNLAAAALFFPLINWGGATIEKLFPPQEHEKEFAVKHLKKNDWESPSVVIAHAEREVLRTADIVVGMIDDSLSLFREEDPDLIKKMRIRDDRVDLLTRELNLYLARNLEQSPSEMQMQMMRLMNFTTDLEAAADVVENQLLELATKKHSLRVEFSTEGWCELEEISRVVNQIVSMSVACFQTRDKDLAAKVIFHKRNVRKLEKRMRESHMARLVKGTQDSINTSTIHLDVLGEYRRIVGLMSNHVYSLLKDNDPYNLLPRREG